jgi:hypothetical protein
MKTGLLELAPSVNTPERVTGEALLHRSPLHYRSVRRVVIIQLDTIEL